MMNSPRFLRSAAALLLAAAALSACTEDKTHKLAPKILLPTETDAERTALDFGTVQINLESTAAVRVRNAGSTALNVSGLAAEPPFGVRAEPAFSLAPGEEKELTVTFQPTVADTRQTGKLVISSNDPTRPQLSLDLAGQGIQAVLVANPNPIDFHDVYLHEPSHLTVTFTNAGSAELDLQEARFTSTVPATVTGNLAGLKQKLASGASTQLALTYTPSGLEELQGALELVLPAAQGGTVAVPIHGRGTGAVTRMCFKFDDEAIETCSDGASVTPNLQVRFKGLCDTSLHPVGTFGGCNLVNSQRSGKLYLRNEGNVPVAYSLKYTPYPYAKDRCDAGYPAEPGFSFSNAPTLADGGVPFEYTVGSTPLPGSPSAPRPWESAAVTITYRGASRCRDEATDLARVAWTRQGEPATHAPSLILLTLDGTSKLPHAVSSGWTCGTPGSPQQVPCTSAFFGLNNSGDAPVQVTSVDLWEETFDAGVPDAGGPNGGLFRPCSAADPGSACRRFGWANVDGGDPNQYAPHLISEAVTSGQPTQRAIGTLVFGPHGSDCSVDGGACPNVTYRIYAVLHTDDPYAPTVISNIQGVARP